MGGLMGGLIIGETHSAKDEKATGKHDRFYRFPKNEPRKQDGEQGHEIDKDTGSCRTYLLYSLIIQRKTNGSAEKPQVCQTGPVDGSYG